MGNNQYWGRSWRRARRWCGWIMLCGLATWLIMSGGSIVAQPSVAQPSVAQTAIERPVLPGSNPKADLQSTPIAGRPIKVSIGLHVSNLAEINQASESFELSGYLLYRWHDPRLAYQPTAKDVTSKTVSLDQIWHPALEMVNFKDSATADISAEILPDGTVLAQERFGKTLSSGLKLRNFPFDRQALQIVLESLKYADAQVELVADASKLSIGTDSFVSLSEWQIGAITANQSKSFFPPEQQHYSRVTIAINVRRNAGFYIFKVILPLLLITIASWSVFWIEPKEFSTQITIAFTNLLTVVALLLVINDSLPRVGYLTLMDGFTMLCFMAILVAILELVLIHRLEMRADYRRAQKLHHLARWAVPLAFGVANLLLIGVMRFLG